MTVIDMSIGALRRACADGALRPGDVARHVLSRLGDPDQESVWTSTPAPDRLPAAAARLGARVGDMAALPLFGVPFSVKDNIDVGAEPTAAACPDFAYVAGRSAEVVARALAAGALDVGKTNLDQVATGLDGVRSPYGAPKNPFNADCIPGGSSAGAGGCRCPPAGSALRSASIPAGRAACPPAITASTASSPRPAIGAAQALCTPAAALTRHRSSSPRWTT